MAYELEIDTNSKLAEGVRRQDHMAGIACEMNNRRSSEDLAWIFKTSTSDGQIKVGGIPFAHLEQENGRNVVVFSSPYNAIYSCRKK